VPAKGTFLPRCESDGARACPGKKFAQVESVALTVALFRDHRVEPMPEAGESVEKGRWRSRRLFRVELFRLGYARHLCSGARFFRAHGTACYSKTFSNYHIL